ncbi:hypothetical protein C7412_11564 [Paraburkholderia silvatlantica]|nr:hypothetical protein C7412_11564 [Paraburkholderia silvatlantica]
MLSTGAFLIFDVNSVATLACAADARCGDPRCDRRALYRRSAVERSVADFVAGGGAGAMVWWLATDDTGPKP